LGKKKLQVKTSESPWEKKGLFPVSKNSQ